jgi:hypothetical protein
MPTGHISGAPESQQCGDDFIHWSTRHRPQTGAHEWQLPGNRKIFIVELP